MVKYQIELNPGEVSALKILLMAEIYKYRDRRMHASSHGSSFQDSGCNHLENAFLKIEMAVLSESDSDS